MAGTIGHYKYSSDDGQDYLVRLDDSNAALLGGVAIAPGSLPSPPNGYDLRYLYVEHPASHQRRKLPAPDSSDGHWTGGSPTVTMHWQEGDAGTVAAIIRGRVGERRRSL